MDEYVLELKNIGKTFSGVNVLRGIDLALKKGEVHALLGENGAGKSTLIKILNGYYQPDRGGEIRIAGREVHFRKPKDALDASIHTIYQELTLCPLMTVAENIVIDKQDAFQGIALKNREFRAITLEALERLGQTDIDPASMVRDLSIAQQQVVEIAKALSSNAQILLMDEPTSSISQQDAEKLMAIIRNLSESGVTIIYISHRLHEIDDIAHRITVLRDGDLVDTVDKDEVNEHDLIRMMVGRELTNVYPKTEVDIGETVFSVEKLSSENTFIDVSFDVRRGEIFGIGGLVGSKRTELLEALFGMRPITGGSISFKGNPFVPENPIVAIRNKIAFITEDRKKNGLVLCLTVTENVNMINAQNRDAAFGYLNWRELQQVARKQQRALNIKLNTLDQIVSTLSGGNQQKVVLGKWLEFDPDVILCDEPTRGIDIGAKTEIYAILGKLARQGAAIIMVSSELPELISIADRIMIMREGESRGIIYKSEATQEKIMTLAALQNGA